ncbi:MAG: hypothetical protein IJ916_01285 [Paludibacteraceae bacterium]|nr:hypothetical protein [Paludibacteraceae bacterium]
MKKFFKRITIIVVCLAIFLWLTTRCVHWLAEREEEQYREDGGCMISAVEEFRAMHNRLPENMSELGMGEDSGFGPFYVKNDSNTYIVFFGLGFDENYVYNSETKEWSHTR